MSTYSKNEHQRQARGGSRRTHSQNPEPALLGEKKHIKIFAAILIAFLIGVSLSIGEICLYMVYEHLGYPHVLLRRILSAGTGLFLLFLLAHLLSALMQGFHGSERRRGLVVMQDTMKALDEISSGNFDVIIKMGGGVYHNPLADKVNQIARHLRSMEVMRQDFVSSVSHEIQSPLTSISGFAALLKDDDLPLEQRHRYLDIIESESKRLSKLSENLLRLTILDTEGDHSLALESYRLDKQLTEMLLMLEPQWSEKELELSLSLPATTIQGDKELLSQVWINLIHNAIKFTPQGGQIDINLTSDKNHVSFTLADSGVGIPEDSLVHIFDRFYKVDKSRDRSVGGNGLGLSLVKKIVDLHKGHIAVRSRVDFGTTFTVTLPLALETPAEADVEKNAADSKTDETGSQPVAECPPAGAL